MFDEYVMLSGANRRARIDKRKKREELMELQSKQMSLTQEYARERFDYESKERERQVTFYFCAFTTCSC